ncbi:MAG: dockerin type I repeat-containing protein [Planctomycetota bacterium]
MEGICGITSAPQALCEVFHQAPPPVFSRGDCNTDGTANIADPIFLLTHLFVPGGSPPACADACDGNDDGSLNIADAVYLLSFLFVPGAPPPPSPSPDDCDVDPTLDTLSCETFNGSQCP